VYGTEGTYDILINRVDDGTNLFAHSEQSIINWRPGADFVRPKWGIYRSLNNASDLRDEMVLFANFSVEEVAIVSTDELDPLKKEWNAYVDQNSRHLLLRNYPSEVEFLRIVSLNGQQVFEQKISSDIESRIEIQNLTQGIYIVNLIGKDINLSKKIFVSK